MAQRNQVLQTIEDEPKELEQQLDTHLISAADVITTIEDLSKGHRSWRAAYWKKEKRDDLLGSECEQCGSTTSSLVLQHTWHPPMLVEVENLAYERYKKDHPLEAYPPSLLNQPTLPTRGT